MTTTCAMCGKPLGKMDLQTHYSLECGLDGGLARRVEELEAQLAKCGILRVPFYGYDTFPDNLLGASRDLKNAIEDLEARNGEGELSVEDASIYASMRSADYRLRLCILLATAPHASS